MPISPMWADCAYSRPLAVIKNQNKKVGISLKPKSKIDLIKDYLDKIDLVLIMSVEPGFGGQKFMPDVLKKTDILYLQLMYIKFCQK